MELFVLNEDDHLVYLNKEWIQLHEPFYDVYKRDKGQSDGIHSGRYKMQATKEFTFIYHYLDYRSKLVNYSDSERRRHSIKDAGLPDNWVPDRLVEAAIEKYKELQDCRELRLLRAAYKTVDVAIEQLEKIQVVDEDSVKLLQSIPKIIKQLEDSEKMVKSSLQATSNSRGDVEIGENEI